jgi:hypothetical protein
LQTDVSLLRWTAAACLASSAPLAVDGQSWRRILWLFSFKKIREWAEKLHIVTKSNKSGKKKNLKICE